MSDFIRCSITFVVCIKREFLCVDISNSAQEKERRFEDDQSRLKIDRIDAENKDEYYSHSTNDRTWDARDGFYASLVDVCLPLPFLFSPLSFLHLLLFPPFSLTHTSTQCVTISYQRPTVLAPTLRKYSIRGTLGKMLNHEAYFWKVSTIIFIVNPKYENIDRELRKFNNLNYALLWRKKEKRFLNVVNINMKNN